MKTLFDTPAVNEVKQRLTRLQPDSHPQWGKMNAAQAVAHCSGSLQWAVGDQVPQPGPLLGRILGKLIKPLVIGNDDPIRRNSPTAKELLVREEKDLETERLRLCGLIDRFAAGGPKGCTRHPHSFFGRLSPEEWANLMYKHLDHHLRQFGV
jgi:hypothetical protein